MAAQPQQLLIVTGPESSGKSTLAGQLADALRAPLVPEVARSYLEAQNSNGAYDADDLVRIATLQKNAEQSALDAGHPLIVVDTDHYVLSLWWREKYPERSMGFAPWSRRQAGITRNYLLCYPDLPWEPDPLRENPLDRLRLFHAQKAALEGADEAFRVVWGLGAQRLKLARDYVKAVITQ